MMTTVVNRIQRMIQCNAHFTNSIYGAIDYLHQKNTCFSKLKLLFFFHALYYGIDY